MTTGVIGFGLAVLSAFFNGSWGVCSKVCNPSPDPVIFNGLLCIGCFLSSMAVAALSPVWDTNGQYHVEFSWWGALAGTLFVFACLFSFVAIPLAGLATANATWCSTAVVVSFLWGSVGPSPPRKPLKSLPLSLLAVSLLIIGALIINLAPQLAQLIWGRKKVDGQETGTDIEVSLAGDFASEDSRRQAHSASREATEDTSAETTEAEGGGNAPAASKKAIGLVTAVIVGFFGGSVLVPASYAPEDLSGLRILPSFGIGALVAGLLVSGTYWLFAGGPRTLREELRCQVVCNGMFAGVLWNLGNVCQVIAQDTYNVPYGTAYPLLQCALLFGGLWGIYWFKEVQGEAVLFFWVGAVLLVGGVVLLGLYGPQG